MEELKEYLARAVAAYEARSYQRLFKTPSAGSFPYKFLDAFAIEDAVIFLGREAATEELYNKVVSNRLSVLHAKSGAGKTSLLNAGISPRFIREGRLPLYVRAYEDPLLAIKRQIASAQLGPWPKLLYELPFYEFMALVCDSLSRQIQEVIVILDQFEQFFLLWPQLETRSPFIRALGACYDDQSLPLRFIIALRKDYYSDLDDFNQVLPPLNVFQNQYRLKDMTQPEAQEAIIGPLWRLGLSVTYEPTLLETLLAELKRGQMELPLLQIICTRLYETRAKDEAQITLKMYEALGRAEGLLSSYLRSVLTELPGRQETLARNVLKELVRSDRMKQVLSYKALAARVKAQGDELDRVLAQLVNARLLSQEEMEGEILYELAHEYLATEIIKWVSSADQEFKQAEELLERELVSWRIQHMPIPKNRLEVLYRYRERFKGLDAEAWECLISSALAEDFAVVDWVKTAGESGERALFQALKASDVQIRRGGFKTLEELSTPRAVEPLLVALKEDEDAQVRRAAAEALGALGDLRAVEPLLVALKEETEEGMRRMAATALGTLGDPRAVEPLITALKEDKASRVREAVAEALGALGDPRAIAPLSAALQDEASGVREQAAEALKAIRDSRAVATFKDKDEGEDLIPGR